MELGINGVDFRPRETEISSEQRGARRKTRVCPGLNANEIQIPHDMHIKVSSLEKSHQTHKILSNMKKYENPSTN